MRTARQPWIYFTILSLLILQGCTIIAASALSPDDVRKTIEFIQQANVTGCAWFRGHGNPPAGQLELDYVFAVGNADYVTCVQVLRGQMPASVGP